MAKKKVARRRRTTKKKAKRRVRDKRIPILPLLGVGVAISKPIENAINGDYMGALAEAGARFTGYNFQSKKFDLGYAFYNAYLPIILGGVGSKIVTKVGGNRAMRNIPFVGKLVKF